MRRRSFLTHMTTAAASLAVTRLAAQASSPKIQFAQIGTGHAHASGKFASIRRLTDLYEIVGIAEADPTLRSRAESNKTYAGSPWYAEAELLALPGLQGVAVETRMAESCSTAARAVAAGKHIHLDKPGSLRHDEFRTMRLDAERRGLTVQMGYMLRYNPAFALLFQAAREGWFGEILEIDCMMGKQASAGLRHELAALPGGGMFELACHLVDAVVTVLGKPERVEAFSTPSVAGPGEPQDNQLAVLKYPHATATIRCNHADPFGGPRRRFQISGTRGTMEIMPLESGKFRLFLSEPHGSYKKGDQTASLELPGDRYIEEFRDLARVIRGEKKLAWDAAHDVAVHETVLRAAGLAVDA